MNTNTVLSNSIDNQTTKNPLQLFQDKTLKSTKIDSFPYLDAKRSNKTLGLIQIQIEVKGKKVFIMGC